MPTIRYRGTRDRISVSAAYCAPNRVSLHPSYPDLLPAPLALTLVEGTDCTVANWRSCIDKLMEPQQATVAQLICTLV